MGAMNQIEYFLDKQPDKLEKMLGRREAKDPNDHNYPLRAAAKHSSLTEKYHYDSGLFLNQFDTPQCVEYSAHHAILDGPITHGKKPLWVYGTLYKQAQEVDEWPGNDYDGTSVRAGAKVLQSMGFISEYRWAWDLNTMVNYVLTIGPCVCGTNWYWSMFNADQKGVIKISDTVAGGHAYVVNGVNTKTKMFRIKNSWGKDWALGGRAYISFADMERLISEEGEICSYIENKST